MRERCSIEGCATVVKARGLCNKHYFRARRGWQVTFGPDRTTRALQFVDDCLLSNTDLCLEPSFQRKCGYPSLLWNGADYRVGWLVLERSVGPRPEGTEMRHLCGNRRCCNPRHLSWGTHLENMDDWKRHGCAGDRYGENNSNYRHGRCCGGQP
jgi:hypothetical protein